MSLYGQSKGVDVKGQKDVFTGEIGFWKSE